LDIKRKILLEFAVYD